MFYVYKFTLIGVLQRGLEGRMVMGLARRSEIILTALRVMS